MSDKGIIFSAPMVRALLDGRKTQTRRLIKLPKEYSRPDMGSWEATTTGGEGVFAIVKGKRVDVPERAAIWNQTTGTTIGMPYAVGDRLYVREAFWIATRYSYGTTPGGCDINPPKLAWRSSDPVHYSADGNPPNCVNRHYGEGGLRGGKAFAAPDPYATWRQYPSIHMPRWASRLWLSVTEVRVEPLQKITLGDICAEGLASSIYDFKPIQRGFAAWMELWNSLHTTEGERWQDDPWIVAVTFDVHHGNIDQEAASEHA